MPIEGFDYKNFAQVLSSQANELLPEYFDDFQRNYVSTTLLNFATLAGEALYNDSSVNLDANQAMLITQIIAEWSFHKSVDLIKSGVLPEHWDIIMQKVAFTIFEIAKQTVSQGLPQEQVLQIVEHHVQSSYKQALEDLKTRGIIDEELFDKASHQSNIDEMMNQANEERLASSSTESYAQSDSKILKLASVALLLKELSADKVKTILNKFNQEDAKLVIQYMQSPDLSEKVDKGIALKCLQEIKTTLPEPKKVSPNIIVTRFKKLLSEKGKSNVENKLAGERENIRKFAQSAIEGEYSVLPTKVANVIIKHLEESIKI